MMRDPKLTTTIWSPELTLRVRIEEAKPFSQSVEIPTPEASAASLSSMSSSCKFKRRSSQSLAALRGLRKEDLIVLFTPVLVPAKSGKSAASKAPADPFEPLGRAISEHHKRVRHVPYVPKIGLTDIHAAFVRHAAVVVVVACEPAFASQESLKHQATFARSIIELRDDLPEPERTVFYLVRFGNSASPADPAGYETIVQSNHYSPGTAIELTDLLFRDNEN